MERRAPLTSPMVSWGVQSRRTWMPSRLANMNLSVILLGSWMNGGCVEE